MSSIYKNAWLEVGKEGIGSLKLEHYLPIYDEVFKKYYGKDITYLEIGVSKGGSLATARKVFGKNSTILGCDIVEVKTELDKKGGVNILTSELEKRINAKVIIGKQADDTTINKICKASPTGKFDIIVDDGSHLPEDQVLTFIKLWDKVNNGGTYIVEDTHTVHSPAHFFYYKGLDCYDYFTSLTRKLNDTSYLFKQDKFKKYKELTKSSFENLISSITFHEGMIVIKKEKRQEAVLLRNNMKLFGR